MDIFSDNIINDREIVSIFYNPLWGQNRDKNYFSQTVKYKLYEDVSFQNMNFLTRVGFSKYSEA